MDQCDKKALRKEYKIIRRDIKDKTLKSTIISNKIKNLEIFKDSLFICFYKHKDDEVDIDELIEYSLKENKKVYLPRVIDDDNMEFYEIKSMKDLNHLSDYSILEPNITNVPDRIDLMIVPGIVFSMDGYRVGYGKGYYDKYLNNRDIYTIGVTYKECIVPKINTNSFDKKMNIIITD